jgi:nucleoside diphosphate kinase
MKHRIHVRRALATLSMLVVVGVMSGCATPATHEGMIPRDYDTPTRHARTVSIKVGGGQETSAMWKSQISDEAFSKALVEAITKSQVFSKVIEGQGGEYLLNVGIISMDQPSFGLNFTVKMEAGWSLVNAATGQVVWQKAIKSEHTATAGDAMVGATRLRLANEGAARNNIQLGLAEISRLKL